MYNNINLFTLLDHNTLQIIIEYLVKYNNNEDIDPKIQSILNKYNIKNKIDSIRSLYNSCRLFRFNNNESINKIFIYNGCKIVIVKSQNELLEIKKKYPLVKSLKIDFDEQLNDKSFNEIKSSLKYLEFGDKFNQELDSCFDGLRLSVLKFGYDFNMKITIGNFLWMRVEKIYFGHNFNQKLHQKLNYYVDINKCIFVNHNELYEIHFGDNFNQDISCLRYMGRLKILKFGKNFNQQICDDYILTSSTGNFFRYSLSKFPNSLEELYLGDNFNKFKNRCECLNNLKVLSVSNLCTTVKNIFFEEKLDKKLIIRHNNISNKYDMTNIISKSFISIFICYISYKLCKKYLT